MQWSIRVALLAVVSLLVPVAGYAQVVMVPGGGEPRVRVLNPDGTESTFFAYDPLFAGGVRAALGDVNGDGMADIVMGAGPSGGPHVRVLDGATLSELASFYAYDPRFTGGIFVAAGDVDGDGRADIITGAGEGGAPHVRVFSGADLAELASFYAYDPIFTGGVSVAAGDVNGDGLADIITGAGPSGGPHVKVLSGADLSALASFFAYDPIFAGGVSVASADVNGDGLADIITGAGPTGGPHVKVLDGATLGTLASFFAYDPLFTGGVSVAAADFDGDGEPELVTGAGPGGSPHVRVFRTTDLAELAGFYAFDPTFSGGVFIGSLPGGGGAGILRFTSAPARTFVVGVAGTFTIATAGGRGTVALSATGTLPSGVTFTDAGDGTGTLAGSPAAGAVGTYPLTITATEGARTTTQVFTLTVMPNQPPVAVADGYTLKEGGTVSVVAQGVLVNDVDPDSSSLIATLVTGPANAVFFRLNTDGSFTYVHDGSETLIDGFTYRVSDGTADSNVATVTLTITSVDDPLEGEPNDSVDAATALAGSAMKITGNIFPAGDVDYYSFTAQAGDRVYAATMTSASASGSVDSGLAFLASDGSTVLESDDDDGSFGNTSSSIAGATIAVSGTYYLRVSHNAATTTLRPYDLWFQVRSGAPSPETEPNDAIPGQALPASGWVSGALSSTTDVDYYAVTLNAGDSVFASLDLDPERDGVEWNGSLGLALFGTPGGILPVNDAGATTPDSEAHFVTVKDAGTYYVVVSTPPGGTTFGTYQLSVSVLPAATAAGTTYTSTDVPVTIPTGPATVTSTIAIPDDIRIGQLKVAVDLTHNFMADLDVTLTSPDGNTVALFTDVGSITVGAQTGMNMILDDNAALPIGLFTAVSGLVFKPELNTRLEWFKGQRAQGTWTLTIRDDAAGDAGTLNGWSLIVVEEAPLPDGTPRTIFTTDFESNDGGFTHSGTQDEWEWGTPVSAPITTANSGVNAWKTDLDNTYNASSSQDLFSPEIDLTGVTAGAVLVEWAMKFQIESATFDRAFVEIQEVGGEGRTRKVWEWLGATMTMTVGNPSITIQESGGWGRYRAVVNDFFGRTIRLRFHLDTDTTVQLGGLAIDDVSVTAFEPSLARSRSPTDR